MTDHRNNTLLHMHYRGFSMFPFIRPGDRLIARRAVGSPLKIGDVVLFAPHTDPGGPALTAHRIVEIPAADRFVTKGDNRPFPDRAIKHSKEIRGRGILIIRKNRMLSLTRGPYGRAAKFIARLSRMNLTPGLIVSRLKQTCRRC